MSKRPLSFSLSMADRGPWDPDDDAYNERVSLDDGGEKNKDPSSHTRKVPDLGGLSSAASKCKVNV